MNILEFLDAWDQRRMHRPRTAFNGRAVIAFGFLAGYYLMVYRFMRDTIPTENIPLVRDAMLVLGPAVGLIVGAIFRSDARDDQAAVNTGEAFKAMGATARAAEAAAVAAVPTGPSGQPGDPVHTVEEGKR